jgi:hypothetical protein
MILTKIVAMLMTALLRTIIKGKQNIKSKRILFIKIVVIFSFTIYLYSIFNLADTLINIK